MIRQSMNAPVRRLAAALFLTLAAVGPTIAQDAAEIIDYFATNVVSTRFGQEDPEDGVRHLTRQSDGRTTLEEIEGVPCRYLNRGPENKAFGHVYFNLHPDFNARELKTARIDVEYRVTRDSLLRLQYDAIAEDDHKPYKGAVAQGAGYSE